MQEILQQRVVKMTEFLAEPKGARERVLTVKAIGGAGIKHQMKAQFDDEQGMLEEEAAQLAGGEKPFADAQQEGFEVGTFGMGRSPTRRALVLPLLNEGPIQEGKEGAVVLDQGIMLEQSGHRRMGKVVR